MLPLVGMTVVAVALLSLLIWLGLRHRALRRRFAPVLDIDAEVRRQRETVDELRARQEALLDEIERRGEEFQRGLLEKERNAMREVAMRKDAAEVRIAKLETDYTAGHATFLRLKRELALLQEQENDISYGLYKPTYSFDTPERYKQELDRVWERQKALVREDKATACPYEWTVHGSKADGKRMQKQLGKLMLRAFNGECEAAVAKVTWNNATRMEERIRKAFDAINNLGTVIGVSITPPYLALALEELRLTHEWEQKKQEVLEEQREIRERLREEEKALREAQRAQEEAAKEEQRYEKALAKARKELEKAKGAETTEMQAKIAQLEASLAEAQALKERAKSMAELTKSGYVYVISNLGSFGENVYKIGMTRRLEPTDRVKELGDASVPFEFDVHAMFYTEDAPRLENEFHRHFGEKRVNLVNNRKEFFTVSLDEIDAFVKQRGLALELTRLAEAREFRQSVALRTERTTASTTPARVADPFPERIVATTT